MRNGLPAALAASLGLAFTASATAAVGQPTTTMAPAVSPVDIPGAQPALHQGDALRPGDRLVRRVVSLPGTATQTVVMRCPAGSTLDGLGLFEGSRVGFRVIAPYRYGGRPAVKVLAYRVTPAPGTRARGSLFALCR